MQAPLLCRAVSGIGGEEREEDLGDPLDDPDSDDADAFTTFNPEDPESISESLGLVAEAAGAVAAAACRAALKEATQRFPTRGRLSDGIMGDMSHQARKSDHNQGNAFDLTDDPGSGCDAHGLVEQLKQRQDPRVRYIISKKRIWNPSVSPAWRTYSGSNPHIKHAHVSIRASQRDNPDTWWTGADATANDARPTPASRPPSSPQPPPEVDMPKPQDVTDEVDFGGGVLHLTYDGGIRILDRSFRPHPDARSVIAFVPFSYPGLPPEARQGDRGFYRIRVDPDGQGYTLIATDGSRYHFPS